MPSRALRLLLRIARFVCRPRTLTREDKMRRGLKYCHHPGNGWRWFRGKRVQDEAELKVMAEIVTRRQHGESWQAIAAGSHRNRVVAKTGREWSPSRVRRAYLGFLRTTSFEMPV